MLSSLSIRVTQKTGAHQYICRGKGGKPSSNRLLAVLHILTGPRSMLYSKSHSQPAALTVHLAGRSASLEDIEMEIQKRIQSSAERHRERRRLGQAVTRAHGKPGAEQSLQSCTWSRNRTQEPVIKKELSRVCKNLQLIRVHGFPADIQFLILYKAENKSLEGLYDLERHEDSQNSVFL